MGLLLAADLSLCLVTFQNGEVGSEPHDPVTPERGTSFGRSPLAPCPLHAVWVSAPPRPPVLLVLSFHLAIALYPFVSIVLLMVHPSSVSGICLIDSLISN